MTEIFICEPHILRSIAIPIFFDKWRSISISLFALYNWDLFSTSNMLTFLHIIVCFSCYLMLLSLSLSHTHTHTHTNKNTILLLFWVEGSLHLLLKEVLYLCPSSYTCSFRASYKECSAWIMGSPIKAEPSWCSYQCFYR